MAALIDAQNRLRAYLSWIGFVGEPRPDLPTLRQMHRRHVETVRFENLDIQLGRPVSRDPNAAYAKIVERGRGGWCFESNGLFASMLEAVGFRVRRLAGAVMREKAGDAMIGNHLVLLVEMDRLYLADAGGTGLFEPVPLEDGPIRQGFRRLRLERLADGWWRFHNHPGATPPSFDLSPEVADEALLDGGCEWLQSDPASPFVIHAIAQRNYPDRAETLVGRAFVTLSAEGLVSKDVESEETYRGLLARILGKELKEAAELWAKVSRAPAGDFLATI
jgi:N-hydroxyarylamine O-acetyltransferase